MSFHNRSESALEIVLVLSRRFIAKYGGRVNQFSSFLTSLKPCIGSL